MTVDWQTKEVTIPQADLTLVSGTFYTGATDDLRILMKEEEASEEGMVFPDISRHNTEVGPIVGTTYARTVEIINGYSLTFSPDSAWSVQLEGSNNNMWDIAGGVLNQNQVQVIPTNSAGLVNVGDITAVRKANINKVTRTGNIITIYEDDGVTIWKQFDLTNDERIEL